MKAVYRQRHWHRNNPALHYIRFRNEASAIFFYSIRFDSDRMSSSKAYVGIDIDEREAFAM